MFNGKPCNQQKNINADEFAELFGVSCETNSNIQKNNNLHKSGAVNYGNMKASGKNSQFPAQKISQNCSSKANTNLMDMFS